MKAISNSTPVKEVCYTFFFNDTIVYCVLDIINASIWQAICYWFQPGSAPYVHIKAVPKRMSFCSSAFSKKNEGTLFSAFRGAYFVVRGSEIVIIFIVHWERNSDPSETLQVF